MTTLTTETTASLLAETNDISLIVDARGIIRDAALGSEDPSLRTVLDWVGQPWIDTVTQECRQKIKDLLSAKGNGGRSRWRQVNHPLADLPDLPVLYKTVPYGDGTFVAVGRDLRPISQLQQRLLDAQHSMEREYARLHQAETRYRMLFSLASEAILIVDADSRKIVEANPAAGKLLDRPAGKLINRAFPRGFSDASTDAIEDLLLRVRAAGQADPIIVHTAGGGRSFDLNASLIRRDEGPFFLVRMAPHGDTTAAVSSKVLEIVERSPDAFVVTDPDGRVLAANAAFLDMCQVATELQVANQPLDHWLGRAGVDVNLLLRNLRDRVEVQHFVTTLQPEFGESVDVELSAVAALDIEEPCCGFVIRRRFVPRAADKPADVLPKSLTEMTELVGRVPLKDLVRETTDIIERLCIEAALKMTQDSRASAAEMLGLSRQSLYVKLRRYGLGDLDSDKNHDRDDN